MPDANEYALHDTRQLPVVLVLAGHDPSGGAGLTADAETIGACGGWPLTIPTALTVQNSCDVSAVMPCRGDDMRAMAAALGEFSVSAIKVGLVADLESLDAVVDIVRRYPGVPVVVDPVLRAGGGRELSSAELIDAFHERLLPLVDILTPNRAELARLTDSCWQNDTDRAIALMAAGCQAVLVTGTDSPTAGSTADKVVHTLHTPDNGRQWQWPRLAGNFHGSGCTLAASLAAHLAAGESLIQACELAQGYTWQTLRHGWRPADGQALPRRLWRHPCPATTSE
ncbi:MULTISPECIES: bifunctional hydroxymethylpyrimidine kinase/phosphomethylpyrimidine kinase [Halomonadaceae]|jgi:hydroxymethylpyrimidine/phosphomethylpyrimidine kinase|uniref:bifunctional hydroxymethylpyrimidine kinase/phosphomethylpyrimidine kinase n=1 Tax=Halomonadaceae TaxID=28256 RepID=UPI001583CACB|nr:MULTISPECIES: hydroxymethylpyrimidine/phosphomethylpyrimidine kinase [Halomonas]MDI4636399.1 hydroxymethylpyrimidine/phosphomethylpyrimidine kinase [Halomonas sp. BMC7]NUJ60763.1 hydroxymethylpyrimidine/phosphomethylpyrimidine kinase [Halomonas taeanensis]|tara:strand:- start:5026 stop:5874 length:849 start_codon:yes stop_codon:yes gene_type:complete